MIALRRTSRARANSTRLFPFALKELVAFAYEGCACVRKRGVLLTELLSPLSQQDTQMFASEPWCAYLAITLCSLMMSGGHQGTWLALLRDGALPEALLTSLRAFISIFAASYWGYLYWNLRLNLEVRGLDLRRRKTGTSLCVRSCFKYVINYSPLTELL